MSVVVLEDQASVRSFAVFVFCTAAVRTVLMYTFITPVGRISLKITIRNTDMLVSQINKQRKTN